ASYAKGGVNQIFATNLTTLLGWNQNAGIANGYERITVDYTPGGGGGGGSGSCASQASVNSIETKLDTNLDAKISTRATQTSITTHQTSVNTVQTSVN